MIEPSKLIARLMTFVLAGCLTIFVILAATLARMFPLDRTEVFLLSTRPAADQLVAIRRLDMTRQNLTAFKETFLKEYIYARNGIVPSNQIMQRRWRADEGGLVYAYSSPAAYADFTKTDMWHAIMEGKYKPLTFRCDASFDSITPREIGGDVEKYAVRFKYVCVDESTGQSTSKDFTIAASIAFQNDVKWSERLDNPLGMKVVGYEIESGGADPLNIL